MKTSSSGLAVIRHYESCKLKAYPDPATGGAPWTIGVGCTGPGIRQGTVWTQAQADTAFADRLAQEFEPGVSALVTVPLKQCQFDALVSLAFNIGLGNFKSSTLLKMLNAGNLAGASEQFFRWNRAAGQIMRGLTRRRASEQALFMGASGERAIEIGLVVA